MDLPNQAVLKFLKVQLPINLFQRDNQVLPEVCQLILFKEEAIWRCSLDHHQDYSQVMFKCHSLGGKLLDGVVVQLFSLFLIHLNHKPKVQMATQFLLTRVSCHKRNMEPAQSQWWMILDTDVTLRLLIISAISIVTTLSLLDTPSNSQEHGSRPSKSQEIKKSPIMTVSPENHFLLHQEEEPLLNLLPRVSNMDGHHSEMRKLSGTM